MQEGKRERRVKRDKMEMREVWKKEPSRWEEGKKLLSTEWETDLILGKRTENCWWLLGPPLSVLTTWSKNLAPVFQPVRSKDKISRTLNARFFPRFEQVAGNCKAFWLVYRTVWACCDWSELLQFCYWFFDCHIKTAEMQIFTITAEILARSLANFYCQ